MSTERTDVVIVGGGQAGVAMSGQLKAAGVDHIVLEKDRIAEAWRTARWDSLVANGPAWHDRFPDKAFDDTTPDGFATKESCAAYFEAYAREHDLPIRTGVTVERAAPAPSGSGYLVETSAGAIEATHVVAATGPFQHPVIPNIVPADAPVAQMHSQSYRNPDQLAPGAVLVIGAGSSGSQIADELLRAGREVYLSVGPHDRPPRRYRGRDFVYWLGVLGKWEMKTPPAGREHVTIAVSGAYGGRTVDFRKFAARGMRLLGMATTYENGALGFADDLARNIREGDENLLSLLAEADAYVSREGLDFPLEDEAKIIDPDPPCMANPTRRLGLSEAGIGTIIWATGYRQDFSWLQADCFDERGAPIHREGVAAAPGVYFLGLPWLSMRGSSFIWGVYVDAARLADQIAARLRG